MVRYNGRNKLLTSAVNGNQIGLKMGGAAPSVGSAISTRRHTKRRVRDNLKFCGPVYYRGQLWNFNTENCVVRAPITQASAGGVGHINHPRKKCNSNCSLEKCNIADSIKLVRQYFIKKYGEDGIALVAPAETLASDGINEHINGPILHFDPNHSPYYTLPKNIREAVDCINALELKYRLKDSPDKKRHIVGHLPQDTQQALRAAHFGNFMETFGSGHDQETIYAFGRGVNTADLKKLVGKYLDAENTYYLNNPGATAQHAAEALADNSGNAWNNSRYSYIGDIPTGPVTDMSKLFSKFPYKYDVSRFNQPLNKWDTSRVTNMNYMFYGATVFDQPLNTKVFNQGTSNEYTAWDTSLVTDMSSMFKAATDFNRDISRWNTENVTNMSYMFAYTEAFNQKVSSITTTTGTKYSYWNTSSVTDFSFMFYNATKFNKPVYTWTTDNATTLSFMFAGATAFNKCISRWNVKKVTDFSFMFYKATHFNNGTISVQLDPRYNDVVLPHVICEISTSVLTLSELQADDAYPEVLAIPAYHEEKTSWTVKINDYIQRGHNKINGLYYYQDYTFQYPGRLKGYKGWLFNTSAPRNSIDMTSMFEGAINFNPQGTDPDDNDRINWTWDIASSRGGSIAKTSTMFYGALALNVVMTSWTVPTSYDYRKYMFGRSDNCPSYGPEGQPRPGGAMSDLQGVVASRTNMFGEHYPLGIINECFPLNYNTNNTLNATYGYNIGKFGRNDDAYSGIALMCGGGC